MASLNIKDEEVYRLAQELAEENNSSMTAEVREALRERRARLRRDAFDQEKYDYWRKVAKEIRASIERPIRSTDIDALLYDDRGLPK